MKYLLTILTTLPVTMWIASEIIFYLEEIKTLSGSVLGHARLMSALATVTVHWDISVESHRSFIKKAIKKVTPLGRHFRKCFTDFVALCDHHNHSIL